MSIKVYIGSGSVGVGLGLGPLGSMPLGGVTTGGPIDRVRYVEKGSLQWTNVLTKQADTAKFRVVSPLGDFVPTEGQEVAIHVDGVKKFGGFISMAERAFVGPGALSFACTIQDFTRLLEKRLVTKVYNTPQTAGAIVRDLLTFAEDDSIDDSAVEDGTTIDFISFQRKTVAECIREVAKQTGMDWYIDETRVVHFFDPTTSAAPWDITESETRYREFKYKPNITQLRNRVIVQGGTTVSDPFTENQKGDGTRTTFTMAYKARTIPTVSVNGTPKTIGIDGVDDDGAFQFLWNQDEKLIKNGTHATLGAGDTITLVYTYDIPVLVQVDDFASQTAVAAIDGSDGVHEYVITDTSIEDIATARERAKAEIRTYGQVVVNGSFETFQSGFRSGQLLTVNLPSQGINSATFLIRSVRAQSLGPDTILYAVEFGSYSFEFEDFLLALLSAGKRIAIRESEIVNDFGTNGETVTPSDALTQDVFKAPPFEWGPATKQTKWNEGQWA